MLIVCLFSKDRVKFLIIKCYRICIFILFTFVLSSFCLIFCILVALKDISSTLKVLVYFQGGSQASDSDDVSPTATQRPPKHHSDSRERMTSLTPTGARAERQASRDSVTSRRSSASETEERVQGEEGEFGNRSLRLEKDSPPAKRKTFIKRGHQR